MAANDDVNPPCCGCGGPHPFDTTVPSVRWNAVIRKAGLPDYLCLTCIVTAFVKAGESFTAELVGGEHHFEPIEVRTRSQNAIDAQALSNENTELRATMSAMLSAPSAENFGLEPEMQPVVDELRRRMAASRADPEELLVRVQNYFNNGGFFNPELMDHAKVRNLLLDVKTHLSIAVAKSGAT